MPTTFYPTSGAQSNGSSSFPAVTLRLLSLSRGAGVSSLVVNTIASLNSTFGSGFVVHLAAASTSFTPGIAYPSGTVVFVSDPLNAVSITGSITANIRAAESNAMANYGVGVIIGKIPAGGGAATAVRYGGDTVELGTTESARTITLASGTITISSGDRLFVVIGYYSVGGTSASGYTATAWYDGTSGGASGDAFITFSETITAQSGPTQHVLTGSATGAGTASASATIRADLSGSAAGAAAVTGAATIRAALSGSASGSGTASSAALTVRADLTGSATGTGSASSPVAANGAYMAEVLADSPVAYYRMGEPSGSVIDETGGSSGSVVGTATRDVSGVPAADDGAIDFAATGYVSIPHQSKLNLGDGPLSLELWIKITALPPGGGEAKLIDKGGSGAYQVLLADNGQVPLSKAGVAEIGKSTTTLSVGPWHHIVITKNGSTTKIYLNGVDRSGTMTDQTLTDTTGALILGRNRNTVNDPFNGAMDEVALYNSVLSPTRVAAHYAAGSPASVTHVLTGSASGTGAATGSITARMDLTGSAAGTGSATGTTVSTPALSGSASGAGSATGSATIRAVLSGSAAGAGTTSTPTATIRANLTGSASGVGTASAAPTSRFALSGSATGSGAATGSATVRVDLSGSAAGSGSSSTPTATIRVNLTGSALGTGNGSGTVDPGGGAVTHALSGSATGAGAASGSVTVRVILSGSALGSGTAAGTTVSTPALTGAATGSGNASGSITSRFSISGSATGTGNASGTTQGTAILSGSATGAGQATGSIVLHPALQGAATGSGAATGAITLRAGLSGAAAGSGAATGSGTIRVVLTGAATGAASAIADLTVTAPFVEFAPGKLRARVTQNTLSATVAAKRHGPAVQHKQPVVVQIGRRR